LNKIIAGVVIAVCSSQRVRAIESVMAGSGIMLAGCDSYAEDKTIMKHQTAPVYIFVCPACKDDDTHPHPGSRRWVLWEQFGLRCCGDCGAQFQRPACVLVDDKEQLHA
jgi:hypothetical protein